MVNGPKFKGSQIDVINRDAEPSKLPHWVKCCVCGKPPIGADWLKPVNLDPNCRKFVHLSHISGGPKLSEEAGFILRNS